MKLSKLIEYFEERLDLTGDCEVEVMQEVMVNDAPMQVQSQVTDVAFTGKSVVVIGLELM